MDQDKAYHVLGVKPGVSNRELKAAHRDLAKVWHPDRFLHDPRLQEKAQEKLKEINEAYELLISGKTPRPASSQRVSTQTQTQTQTQPQPGPNRSGGWVFVLLVFIAVFAFTTRVLLNRHRQQPLPEPEVVEETQEPGDSRGKVVERAARPAKEGEAASEVATNETVAPPSTAMATVTVTVDPETGLLARPECRLRSRMTYPTGAEPTSYCNLPHTPPPKDSTVKSIAKSVKRALD